MNFNCVINTGSSTPIYKQITDQVRLAVATGRLTAGDQLPSVRALAETLVLNPNTVARAYSDLAREGLLESRPGRGVFIIRKRKVFTREEGRHRLEPMLEQIRALGVFKERTRGTFYLKSKAFLHFNEDPAGLFADVRAADGQDFDRVKVDDPAGAAALLARAAAAVGRS